MDARPGKPIETDAVVVGAGPVGMYQVFQLGLQGIHAHMVDALPHLGGQCAELYPDKFIYDIPAVQACTGRELVQLLQRQIQPFAPTLHLGQQVGALSAQTDGRWLLETTHATQFLARTVFIAAGVGAFVPRTLKLDGIARFVGTQVHYSTDHLPTTGQHVVVHGGDEAAVAHAIALAEAATDAPASVTLLHRRDAFQAPAADLERLQALRAAQRLRVVVGQIIGLQTQDNRLEGLLLIGSEGTEHILPLDMLVALLGLSPRLGPIAEWSLAMERKQLVVDTEAFRTNAPGIYAVGDINTYPGKRKLLLCGFHEATLAAFGAAEYLSGDKIPLQYTTTSTRLHQLLGVVPS